MTYLPGILGSLIPLLFLGGIIAGVVWLFRRRTGREEDPGIGPLKRFYYYGLSFVALMVAASGLSLLVDYVADVVATTDLFSRGQERLALGIAMTLVGTPVWMLLWHLAQRSVVSVPWESRALGRRVYIYLVLTVSAAVAASGLITLLRWAFRVDEFNGGGIALPLVWGAVWAYHWQVARSSGREEVGRDPVRGLYQHATAWYGLGMLTVGSGIVLWRMLLLAYDTWLGTDLLYSDNTGLWGGVTATAVAVALVGAAWWWWHWHWAARADAGSPIRQVYLNLFTILPGTVAVLVSLTILLFRVLQLALGGPDDSVVEHFRIVPWALPVALAGTALWGYHWTVARQEAPSGGGVPAGRRIYRYLVAAVGLAGLGVGLVLLIAAVIGGVAATLQDILLEQSSWDVLALALALLVVGIPIWWYHWSGVQREVHTGAVEEVAAPARRFFVYLIFGAAALIALGNLSAILFMVLRDALEGSLSPQLVQDIKWSIAMVIVAGAGSGYHWLVLKEDQRMFPEEEPERPQPAQAVPGKTVIAVAAAAAQPLLSRLEERLGIPVRVWQRLDQEAGVPELSEEELEDARERISAAPGDRVLLTIDASGVGVVPYRE